MMYSNEEVITPEIAEAYLTRNKSNRRVKFKAIRNYARDMKAGKWQLNPDGICFYEDGTLANGQHRLMAVVRSKTPTKFYVTRNVPMDAFVFDRGVLRSTPDVLHMVGDFSPASSGTEAVAMMNFLFTMAGNNNVSERVRIEFITENCGNIDKAVNIAKLGGRKSNVCRSAPVTAAIFSALYCGVSEDTLKDFCSVANSGFYDSSDQTAAIVLRRFIQDKADTSNHTSKKKAFITATNAISDFAHHKSRRKDYNFELPCAYYDKVKAEALDKYLVSYNGLT